MKRGTLRQSWHLADDVTKSDRHQIYVYLGLLTVLLELSAPFGALIDLPVSFLLKNKLHLTASQISNFRLLVGLPLYLSVVFGFIRDIWSPFGLKDRGFFMLFGAIGISLYVGLPQSL